MAASLSDSNVLGVNGIFIGRVQSSLCRACVAIFAEGIAVNNHRDRVALVHQVLSNPTNLLAWATNFAMTVATDTNVLADATQAGTVVLTTGTIAAQQALATDAHINSAVDGQFNAFCAGIPA
jgi:hypothetical protein